MYSLTKIKKYLSDGLFNAKTKHFRNRCTMTGRCRTSNEYFRKIKEFKKLKISGRKVE